MSIIVFPVDDKKRPIVKGWQNYTGEVTTPMRGIKVPNGVYIIDIDLYKGVVTDDVDKVLGCEPDWNTSLLQTTLNGGKHYAFRCDNPNMLQGSDVLGIVGFDTRVAGKGYIATGDGYTDETLFGIEDALANKDFLPELPQAAIDRLTAGAAIVGELVDDDFDNSLMLAVSSQPLDVTNDEVEQYLAMLSDEHVDDQDMWLRVGFAVHHQTGGSVEGYRLFDDFSKRSKEKYNESANRYRWKSFGENRPSNPITFASVIKAAGGRTASSQVAIKTLGEKVTQSETANELKGVMADIANANLDSLAVDVLLRAVQDKYSLIGGAKVSLPAVRKEVKSLRVDSRDGSFVDDYVYVTASAEYLERSCKAKMGQQAFNVKHNRITPVDQFGDPQPASKYADRCIEIVHDTMYHPQSLLASDGDPIFHRSGMRYFNTYTPTSVKRVPVGTTNTVDLVRAHIAHLLPNPDEQDIIINFLAHNAQRPGVKIPWGILLQGIPGDGKSVFSVMMAYILDDSNVRILDPRELGNGFTGWAVGQCMTFIEEVKISNASKYDTMNSMKPYMSNETVPVTRKGYDPITAINTTNYFMLTNYQDSIPIDNSDRRYAVFFSQWQNPDRLAEFQKANPDYYETLYSAIRNNPGELLDWLITHKIPDSFLAMQRAPLTASRSRMLELSKSVGHEQVEDALEEFGDRVIDKYGELNLTMLQDLVAATDTFDVVNGRYKDFPIKSHLGRILVEMGFQQNGRRKVGDSDRRRYTFYKKN